MADIIAAIGSVFTMGMSMVTSLATLITKQTVAGTFDNPILLLFIVIPLVGLGVGLFRRLINVN